MKNQGFLTAGDLDGVTGWKKSVRSGSAGHCGEVVRLPGGAVAIRNSNAVADGALVMTGDEWAAFLGGARDGEFDTV